MRKHHFGFLFLLITLLCSCGNPSVESIHGATEETVSRTFADETAATENNNPGDSNATYASDNLYADVLNHCYTILKTGSAGDSLDSGETGVWEASLNEAATTNVGYTITDVTGDGIEELIIGAVADSDANLGNMIYTVYTYTADGAVLALEGWSRNRFYILGDDSFYNEGSSGAVYSCYGVYTLSSDGQTLNCAEFCFTNPDDNAPEEIRYFRNTTGSWVPGESEEISYEYYSDRQAELVEQTVNIVLTPFSLYAGEKSVYAEYAQSGSQQFDANPDEDGCVIAFVADRAVVDLALYRLTYAGENEPGVPVWTTEILSYAGTMKADETYIVELTFHGDMPEYAISYKDSTGLQQIYFLEMSGKDGSLLLIAQ